MRLFARPALRGAARGKACSFKHHFLVLTLFSLKLGQCSSDVLLGLSNETIVVFFERQPERFDLNMTFCPQHHDNQSILRQSPPHHDGFSVRRRNNVTVEDQAAIANFGDLARFARSKPDEVAIALHHGLRNPARLAEPALFFHVTHLAVNRDQYLWPYPAIQCFEFGPAGMP